MKMSVFFCIYVFFYIILHWFNLNENNMTHVTRNELSLRRRFVKDFNLPINLIDSPYFEYYMDRYDFFPREDWENLLKLIDVEYGGNIEKWLENYAQIRDNIITSIESSDSYREFNFVDMKEWKIPSFSVGDLNIYNNANTGGYFISIDLKKANFQALKHFNPEIVKNCNTYEDLLTYFGGDDYFKKSKYTRQVIFGKLNPKRTITYEKYLIGTIFTTPNNFIFKRIYDKCKLVTVKSDEIVFEVHNHAVLREIDTTLLNTLKVEIKANTGLDVSVELFHLKRIVCENHNGTIVDGYIRDFYLENKTDLKSVSSIFYPQIYAFSKGLEITDNDLFFRAEDQTAKFCNPLKLI